MTPDFLSITFWFNIYNDHQKFVEIFSDNFTNIFEEYKLNEKETMNNFEPILIAINNKTHNYLQFSKINLQYNMEKGNIENFYQNALKIFDILTTNGIKVLHTAIYTNLEIKNNDALNLLTKNIVSSKVKSDDLIDVNLRFGKKYDDIFYKVISLMNKKQIELPREYDEYNREIPLPLISWNKAILKDEVIDISYEINDKLSFDTKNNYHTEFSYLNKMLYILKNDFADDINNLLNKGKF